MTLRVSTGLRNKLLGYSTNLVTDSTFAADPPTGWTDVTATGTGGVDSIASRDNVFRLDTAAGYSHTSITTTKGHLYRLSWKFYSSGTGVGRVVVGTSANDSTNYDSGELTHTTTWIDNCAYFTATAATTYISLRNSTTDAQYYDDVYCYDISNSIRDIFNLGYINIYSGTQPATADTTPSGTLLVTISNASSATGLTFDDATGAAISKKTGETWSGTCANSGTAGWARLITASEYAATAGTSTTAERIDFAVATVGGQINFSSTSFVAAATQTISTFSLSLPAA